MASSPAIPASICPGASLAQSWDVKQLLAVAPNGVLSQALSQADLDEVSGAVLKACDGLDGATDGLINAHSQCKFDLETLRGTIADDKLDALKAVMAGPVDSDGKALYSTWPVDAGINSMGWRVWKLGTSATEQSDALNVIIGSQSLPRLFMPPPQDSIHPVTMDFGAASQRFTQMGALNDATSTYLSTFADGGGKMIIYHGISDPVFSADDLKRWFERASSDTAEDFARLFLVPGMTHCGGGPALDNFRPVDGA